ncbi:hypothetical protein M758_7G088700 [Ceratodon purpureus]|uniref:P53 and DNA damage-regulated protein 1 n=1 Tax=Ceratodon purpureus TaxID=3225 RepID=A0A8T0H7Z6_CERPU|nr:hypothetical protein KC19_7G096100 [Ceratodon purpureus]KAG0610756.1 hypothetical protein M758_7G088700 [Ceratodon purpureus]
MEDGVQELQKKVAEVEVYAEDLLLARHELVECDKARNGNREALTAMRRQAKTSRSSVVSGAGGDGDECRTCGDYDGSTPVWYMCPGADVFLRRPFHGVHSQLEQEQANLDSRVKSLQSVVKEKTLQLSNSGALADRIAPGLVNALVTLKDN